MGRKISVFEQRELPGEAADGSLFDVVMDAPAA
jgi:hypothetical protein